MPRKFPDWIDGYLKYTENTEPPHSFRLWSAIAAIAGALERRTFIYWDKGKLFSNMYIVLVAKAGRVRKGTAMRPVERMLRDIGSNVTADATTREAIIQQLSLLTGGPQVKVGEIDLRNDSALTIISEEWTVFTGFGNNELMSSLCNWYDCKDEWSYRTKTSGIFTVPNLWVHMFAGTTPEQLAAALPPEAFGGGLSSRTIYVCEADKEKIVVLPLETDAERRMYDNLVLDLRDIRKLQGPFKFTDEFLSVYIPWRLDYEEHPPFKDTIVESYTHRRTSHFMKLSMVLNASRGNDMTLTDKDAIRAIDILLAMEKKMPMAFAGVGKGEHAEVMARFMATIFSRKKITWKELLQIYWRDADEPTLKAMLGTMCSMGAATVQSDANETYVICTDRNGE